MKNIYDIQASYIPLWIYTDKKPEALNKQLPFTELGILFFNEFSIKIKESCIYSVNATSWNDFLSKDAETIYNVLSFVLKYLWEFENIRVPFVNKCNTHMLVTNAQLLQQSYQKLADETADLKSKWTYTYVAEMYLEYVDYIVNDRYIYDKSNCGLGFS
jgi:hypothetical protein